MTRVTSGDAVVSQAKGEMIDKIRCAIDIDRLREIFFEKYRIKFGDAIEYQNGDIVIDQSDIAFKFEYKVTIPMHVTIDSNGNSVHLEVPEASDVRTPEERIEDAGSQAGETAQELDH